MRKERSEKRDIQIKSARRRKIFTPLALMVSSLISLSPALAAQDSPETTKATAVPQQITPATAPLKVDIVPGNFRRLGQKVLVKYPHFTGGDPKVCAKLNRIIQKAMNENAYEDLIEIAFDKTFVDGDSLSTGIKFYRRGGAHRNGFYEPLNYHLSPSLKKMTVQELFGKKLNSEKLSKICAKQIAIRFKNTQETEENFHICLNSASHPYDNFVFDKKGVTFTFCQLTCEAFGVQSFKIPYKDLRGMFGKSSPVYTYAKN